MTKDWNKSKTKRDSWGNRNGVSSNGGRVEVVVVDLDYRNRGFEVVMEGVVSIISHNGSCKFVDGLDGGCTSVVEPVKLQLWGHRDRGKSTVARVMLHSQGKKNPNFFTELHSCCME